MKLMTPPVLLLIFNRPDHTTQVMDQIREAEPRRLYIGADGPRVDHPDDARRCERAREVATRVDWDCEVHTLFRDENLGCREAVSSAITWFFEQEEEGIILEDDCIPHRTFFSFCEKLLRKYRGDERIMMISGTNVNETWRQKRQSYHFSKFGGIWGWATWKSAWDKYDSSMKEWNNKDCKKYIKQRVGKKDYKVLQRKYDDAYNNEVDTWDYVWNFYRVINSGLSIVPSKNLVRNIGFGSEATHTKNEQDKRAKRRTYKLKEPYSPPPVLIADKKYDSLQYSEETYTIRKIARFFENRIKRILL